MSTRGLDPNAWRTPRWHDAHPAYWLALIFVSAVVGLAAIGGAL